MKKIIFPAGILCLILIIAACHDPYVDPYSIHTVTFSAEGGTFDNDPNTSRISMQTDAKGRISNLPAVTRVEAAKTYQFEGWFTPGGTHVTVQTVFPDDTLVVARWKDTDAGNTDERGAFARFLEVWMGSPQGFTFTLSASETLGPQSFESEYLTTPIEIVLSGTSAINTITLSGFGSLFTVGNNVTLRLRNIQLRGHGSNTASLIDIKSGGKVIIESGTVITGNDTESIRHGGGVTVNTGGELLMPAGTTGMIYQNSSAHMSDWLSGNIGGGGVWVRGGTFTMDGGKIEENYAMGAGGVLVTMGGQFTMNGGAIFKCIANGTGGGVRVSGYRSEAADIHLENDANYNPDGRIGSTFTMNGGEIYECESSNGGAISLGWPGTFIMNGGKISKNIGGSGGGIYNLYGIVLLYGGEISENNALIEAGGLMNAGHCEIWDGEIKDNESLGYGGGVMHSPTGSGLLHEFFMYGGKISGNTAQGGGGGLYTIASFDMYGGEISGNTAHNIGGGGVLVGSPGLLLDYGEFTISGGIITGNTCYASGTPSANLAVRGLGKARTAQLGIYWFEDTFTETITEFTPNRDGNGNYVYNEDGKPGDNLAGTSVPNPRTFTGGTLVTDVPIFDGHIGEDETTPGGFTDLYFIPTPLVIPNPPPVTPAARNQVQGSFRIAIGDPQVERITEPGVETFEVIVMDMDKAKFPSNENRDITVVDGAASYSP